jgi:pimeloyl-ACP methyl ester carboxylesterase
MSSFTLSTPHGLLSITNTALSTSLSTLLLLHGNSSSSKIFRHILESPTITSRHRILTFSLPGHGTSSKAPDAYSSYTMRGYADAALCVLKHLHVASVVVVGWSLGGHIGIELLSLLESEAEIKMKGLMLVGAPPALGAEQVRLAFKMGEGLGMAGQKNWSDEDARWIAGHSAAAGKEEFYEEWMFEDARGTDGRARMIMAEAFCGPDASGVDQRAVVETSDVLVAVVNGAEEPFINLQYLEGISWKSLWKETCLRLEGLHHAPFWEDPAAFEDVLVSFLADVEEEAV